MKIDFKGDEEIPTPLEDVVEPDTDLKNWLVEYVGEKKDPENGEVTIGMIVDVVAEEFPDFVLALAEENWIRGYHQAFEDIEAGEKQLAKATGRI